MKQEKVLLASERLADHLLRLVTPVAAVGKYLPSAQKAMFMLVTCSAMINYVRGKAEGLEK